MKKHLFLLVFILVIILPIVPSFAATTLSAPYDTYELQKITKLDKDLDVVRSSTKNYYVSKDIDDLIAKTKSDYAYKDFEKRSHSSGRKALYNQLVEAYKEIYNTGNFPLQTIGGYSRNFVGNINFYKLGLSFDEALEVYYMFKHDNPIFYYASNEFMASDKLLYTMVFEDYASAVTRQQFNTQISTALKSYKSLTQNETNTYNKILKVHDTLCENMYYDYIDGTQTPSIEPYAHNILGGLVYGKGVCESYSRCFEIILNYLDIQNLIVTGKSRGQSHAWNLVKYNNYYYWVDCTWDDVGLSGEIYHSWFMKGTNNWSNHTIDTPSNTGISFLYSMPNNISLSDADPNSNAEDNNEICNHNNTEIIVANKATCLKEGNTEGLKCSDCGEIIFGNKTIPITAHSYVKGKCSICKKTAPALSSPNIKTISRVKSSSYIGKPKISWSKIKNASKYEIYRATSKNGKYTRITTTTSTSYINSTASAGVTYFYKIKAISSADNLSNSNYSAIKSFTCTCSTPRISIKLSQKKPKISWSKIKGASKYQIYRATSKKGKYSKIATTTNTSYINSKTTKGKKYYYKVIAINSKTSSANSGYSIVKGITSK